MVPRRWFPAALAIVVAGGLVMAPTSTAQRSSSSRPAGPTSSALLGAPAPSQEAQFVGRINSLRASRGLPQLQVSGELLGVARAWTDQMVGAGQISHNPDLASQVSGGWTKLGENVGVGYDVDSLMQAFIGSPGHLQNLVDPAWTHVAVGVTLAADGRIFTTHDFMALGGSTPAPPPPAPPTTTPPKPAPPSPPPTSAPTPAPPSTTPPAHPQPSEERVTAVLDPLRALEHG